MDWLIQAFIGFAAGVLGGLLGIGGSLLIIPGLILYLSHTPQGYGGSHQHLIQAAAMICNVFVAAPSVVSHFRAKAVMPQVLTRLVPSALAGIILGVFLTNTQLFAREKGVYLALGLAGFLAYEVLTNLWRLLGGGEIGESDGDQAAGDKFYAASVVLVGLVVGVSGGLLGIGGGALSVPLQQLVLRIPLRRAIANSAVTIVFVSTFGAAYKNLTLPAHGFTLSDSLRLAVMLIPTAIVGSYFGGQLTHLLPRRLLRLTFICFLSVVAWLTYTRAMEALRSLPAEATEKQQVTLAPCDFSRNSFENIGFWAGLRDRFSPSKRGREIAPRSDVPVNTTSASRVGGPNRSKP